MMKCSLFIFLWLLTSVASAQLTSTGAGKKVSGGGGGSTPTFVQATNGGADSGDGIIATSAFGLSTTTGNAFFCTAYWDDSSNVTVASAADNHLNSFVVIGTKFVDANTNAVIHFYSLNVIGGASTVVTATLSGGAGFRRIVCHEVSSILTVLAFDKDSGGSSSTCTTCTGSSVNPTTDKQYIFTSGVIAGGTGSNTLSAGSGFTEPANATSQAGNFEAMAEYQVQTSAGAISPTIIRNSSGLVTMRTSTYKAAP